MANNRCTYQQVKNVSVPKEPLMNKVILNEELSKTDYRIILLLLTELDGWEAKYIYHKSEKYDDPENYRSIDIEWMADTLGLKKKEVRKSIEKLEDLFIIEKGSTNTIKNGYRFTF